MKESRDRRTFGEAEEVVVVVRQDRRAHGHGELKLREVVRGGVRL
jgi:hypothetical protein